MEGSNNLFYYAFFCELVHLVQAKIRQGLAKQGGRVLQIDGPVSVRTRTLYIFRDNINDTILYSALAGLEGNISQENIQDPWKIA